MSNPHFNEFSLQYGISFYKWNLTFHSTNDIEDYDKAKVWI